MSDPIKLWMSNVRGAEYGFFKAVTYALEQFQEKNNIPLTALVAICNGKPFGSYSILEGDRLQYATPLKRILDKALSDARLTFKDGKAKWKVGSNGGVNADVLETLRMLCALDRVSIRSDVFKEHFPVVKKQVEKTQEEWRAAYAKRLAKMLAEAEQHGVKLGDILPQGNVEPNF